ATMFLSASFLEAARADRAPVLLFNGTSAASGQRIITSNVVLDPGQFPDVSDFFQLLPRDIRVSTAVNNTARFPYVAPAGHLCAGVSRDDAIVDGGYFENFGPVPAQQMINVLYWHTSPKLQPTSQLIVTAISSAPDLGSGDDQPAGRCIAPPKPKSLAGL